MICPSCGHENTGERDFCAACDAYLRWEEEESAGSMTEIIPVVVPSEETRTQPLPAAAAVQAETAGIEAVLVTLRLPGDEIGAAEATMASVDAGGQTTLVGLVRNQGEVVDNYDLRVEGMPDSWSTVVPPTVYLVPFRAAGGSNEQEVTVRFHPPRSPEALAGVWPIELVATSRTEGKDVASARAAVAIAAYEQFECRILPERERGKRSAAYVLPIRNLANSELVVSLHGEDADGEVGFAFDPRELRVPPGGEGRAAVKASARRPLTGPERERRLSVSVESAHQRLPGTAVFVQRPWLTRPVVLAWRIALTLLAAALLIGGSFLDWSTNISGACTSADERTCLRYDTYLEVAGEDSLADQSDLEGTIPSSLEGPFNLVTSLGFVTILLGVLALTGARTGTLTWLAGAAAVIFVLALLILGDVGGAGLAVVFLGGVFALAAGLLATASRR